MVPEQSWDRLAWLKLSKWKTFQFLYKVGSKESRKYYHEKINDNLFVEIFIYTSSNTALQQNLGRFKRSKDFLKIVKF